MSLQETADIMVRITVSTGSGELPHPKRLEQMMAECLFAPEFLDESGNVRIISVGINGDYEDEEGF